MSSATPQATPGAPGAVAARPGSDVDASNTWDPWMAPLALIAAFVLANVAAAVVDIPALLLGSKARRQFAAAGPAERGHVRAGCGVRGVRRVLCPGGWAHGARVAARSATSRHRVEKAVGRIVLLIVAFLIFSLIWAAAFHVEKEKLLKQLGADQGAATALAQRGTHMRGGADLRGDLVSRLHLRGSAQLAGDGPGGDHHRRDVRRGPRRLGAVAGPRAARRAGLRPVPALPLHGLALPVHRRALAEQLARVRQSRGVGLADPRADDRRACAIGLLVLALMRLGLVASGTPAVASDVSTVARGG